MESLLKEWNGETTIIRWQTDIMTLILCNLQFARRIYGYNNVLQPYDFMVRGQDSNLRPH